jgi:hypothetical protein
MGGKKECLMKYFVFTLALLFVIPVHGAPANDRDQFVDFFQREVLAKRLLTEVKGKTEDEAYYVDFRRIISFDNMKATKAGVAFEFTVDIKQTNTKLDEKGKPTKEVINRDRTLVRRVELGLRQSTGKLVGFARTLSDTSADPTGDATAVFVEMGTEGKSMEIHHSTVLYDDGTLDEKNFLPCSSAEESTLTVVKGRLKMHQKYMGFRVDTATFEKTLVDQFEVVSYEATSREGL